jgi:hypothetical protein
VLQEAQALKSVANGKLEYDGIRHISQVFFIVLNNDLGCPLGAEELLVGQRY